MPSEPLQLADPVRNVDDLLHAASRLHRPGARPRRQPALQAHQRAVDDEGQDDRADRTEIDLRVEVRLQPFGDELAEAAEAITTDDRSDGDEADGRHRRHAHAGHDQRHRERQLHPPEAGPRRCSPWRRPPR